MTQLNGITLEELNTKREALRQLVGKRHAIIQLLAADLNPNSPEYRVDLWDLANKAYAVNGDMHTLRFYDEVEHLGRKFWSEKDFERPKPAAKANDGISLDDLDL